MIMNMVLAYIAIPLIILSNAPLSSFAHAAIATPSATTTMPIKHLVVIFQENIPFDHYLSPCCKSSWPTYIWAIGK